MVSNIITYAVKDLVDLGIIEKPLDGNHGGIHPKSSDYVEYGIPFIMASDLINGHVDIKGCKFISEEQAKSLRKGFAKEGDVLLSHKATIGRTAVVGKLSTDFIVLTPQITYYRVLDLTRLNPRYLKYYFDSEGFQALFEQWAGGGSTRLYLGITEQMKLPIELPEIKIQNKIVDLVDSFDRKITLNRQINQTLEQMAQALFKSWFVDFDPVVDKALDAGFFEQDLEFPDELLHRAEARKAARESVDFKPLPEDIRKLFPAVFEECSEPSLGLGGWVPKGWKIKMLGEITSELRRGISPKYIEKGGVQVINQKCIRNHEVSYEPARRHDQDAKKIDGRALKLGDVLVNSTGVGTLGRIAQVTNLSETTVADSHVTVVRVNDEACPVFIFGQLMLSIEALIERLGEGSTGQTELSRKILSEQFVVLPPSDIADKAESSFKSFSEKQVSNRKQNSELTKLRDTLLPKLITGELRLDDIATSAADEILS